MRFGDLFPAPTVGSPVRHPFRLPVKLPRRLLRGIPPTFLERRRRIDAPLRLLPPIAAVIDTRVSRIAEIVRERLRRGIQRLPNFRGRL